MKRIFFFAIVNILIIVTISIVLSIFGLNTYITAYGISYEQLAIFSLVWGMGGAFISLAISRLMAKWMMGVKLVPTETRDPNKRHLIDAVYRFARKSGIAKMPEVGIYDSPEVNAFATGPTKNRSLVAVSSGLLDRMNTSEVEGVISHEVAHIANGDMVTMTLVQGIINAFVIFFSRIIAFFISSLVDERYRFIVHFLAIIVFQILFAFLGMFVVAWFSRHREFRADSGGAMLGGKLNMLAALRKLEFLNPRTAATANGNSIQSSFNTLKISSLKSERAASLASLLSTHPPIATRIKTLEQSAIS